MNESLLIIFVKNLIAGKVKTRLGKVIGNQNALKVYKKLVHHTHQIAKSIQADKVVYYSDHFEDNDVWEPSFFKFNIQIGNTLGERMLNAFETSFNTHRKVIIIGSDCYSLTSKIIDQAYIALKNNDLVVGPATDGGYYLLGIKKLFPQFFLEKKFSTSTVLYELLQEAKRQDISVYQLPKLSDIDTYDDLKKTTFDHFF